MSQRVGASECVRCAALHAGVKARATLHSTLLSRRMQLGSLAECCCLSSRPDSLSEFVPRVPLRSRDDIDSRRRLLAAAPLLNLLEQSIECQLRRLRRLLHRRVAAGLHVRESFGVLGCSVALEAREGQQEPSAGVSANAVQASCSSRIACSDDATESDLTVNSRAAVSPAAVCSRAVATQPPISMPVDSTHHGDCRERRRLELCRQANEWGRESKRPLSAHGAVDGVAIARRRQLQAGSNGAQ